MDAKHHGRHMTEDGSCTRKCFCRIGLTSSLQSFSYSNKKTHKYNLLFGGFMRYFGHCVKLCKSKTI